MVKKDEMRSVVTQICKIILVSLSNCLFESQNSEGLCVTFRNKAANEQFLHYSEELLELGGIIFINNLLFLGLSLKVRTDWRLSLSNHSRILYCHTRCGCLWFFFHMKPCDEKKKIASLCVISEAQTEVVRPQVRRGRTSCVMQNIWPDVKSLVPAQNKTIASQFMFFFFF